MSYKNEANHLLQVFYDGYRIGVNLILGKQEEMQVIPYLVEHDLVEHTGAYHMDSWSIYQLTDKGVQFCKLMWGEDADEASETIETVPEAPEQESNNEQ